MITKTLLFDFDDIVKVKYQSTCGQTTHKAMNLMIKSLQRLFVDGRRYIASGLGRLGGLRAMHKSYDREEIGPLSEDDKAILSTLARLQRSLGRGATRAEIASAVDTPGIDIAAALGKLKTADLVVCEGMSGHPPQPCWQVKGREQDGEPGGSAPIPPL